MKMEQGNFWTTVRNELKKTSYQFSSKNMSINTPSRPALGTLPVSYTVGTE